MPDPPRWTRSQVQQMLRKSPLLDLQLLRLMHDSQFRWQVHLGKTNCFNKQDLAMLLKIMGREMAEPPGAMEVKPFARLCSAMWYFRVIPVRISDHIPSSVVERKVEGNGVHDIWIAKDTMPYPVVRADPVQGSIWCWRLSSRDSQETSYRLANIAFVLGWEAVFAAEMETVVCNWTRTATASVDPIECPELRTPGPNRRKGLDSKCDCEDASSNLGNLTSCRQKTTRDDKDQILVSRLYH